MNGIFQTYSVFYNVYALFLISIVIMLIPLFYYADIENRYAKAYDNVLCAYIVIVATVLFGFRGWDIGTDTAAYLKMYAQMETVSHLSTAWSKSSPVPVKDLGFTTLLYYATRLMSPRAFVALTAFLFVFPLYLAVNKMATINKALMLFGFVCFFNFTSLGINVIRQGLSLSFIILSFTYTLKGGIKNTLLFVILAVLGVSFHLSGIIIVVMFLITKVVRGNILYYIILALTFILAYMKLGLINLPIIGPLIELDDRADAYAAGLGSQPPSGLQMSKLVFHSAVIIWSSYNLNILNNKYYSHIYRLFIALTAFYFLCLNMSYSDRFGVMSWMLSPILVGYPLVNYKNIVKYPTLYLIGQYLIFMLYSFYIYVMIKPYLK